MKKATFILLVLFITCPSYAAFAQGSGIDGANLFDAILLRFKDTAALWEKQLVHYASWLFWSLVLISMTWTYGFMVLRKADLQEFLAETLRFFTTTGFFFWILENGPALSIALIDSMREIASRASNFDKLVSPSGIVDIGFDIASKVIDASSVWSPASSIVGILIAAIILVVLALVGVNLLLLLISAWCLAYGGVFLLGFGGGRWTEDIAINYYRQVLNIAMQSFAMILIIGLGKSFIDQYYLAMSHNIALKELLVMLVVAIILLALINKIPPLLGSVVSGGGGLGGGGVGVGGAVSVASLSLATLASGAASMAASAAGGASALKSAFSAAQHQMAGNAHNVTPLSHAFSVGQAMVSNLAQGTVDTVKNKVEAVKDSMALRVADTTGGQVAQAIAERSEAGSENHAGSLAQGHKPSVHDEVAQFVGKGG